MEANCRATMVREKTVATTVMRLPAMVESRDRAAVAPPEKIRGSSSRSALRSRSIWWDTTNNTTAPTVSRPGTNQKLEIIPSHLEPIRPIPYLFRAVEVLSLAEMIREN